MRTMTYHQVKMFFDLGKTPGYRSGSWQQQQQLKTNKQTNKPLNPFLSICSKSNQFDEWILYIDMPVVANSECIMNSRNTGITYFAWFFIIIIIIIKVLELKTHKVHEGLSSCKYLDIFVWFRFSPTFFLTQCVSKEECELAC